MSKELEKLLKSRTQEEFIKNLEKYKRYIEWWADEEVSAIGNEIS